MERQFSNNAVAADGFQTLQSLIPTFSRGAQRKDDLPNLLSFENTNYDKTQILIADTSTFLLGHNLTC